MFLNLHRKAESYFRRSTKGRCNTAPVSMASAAGLATPNANASVER
jgi:hypothetical protein